jgi:nitrous oxidase accessory protein NosD
MSRISVLLLVLVLVTSSPAMVLPVRAESRTIVVPDDYPTVSLAIENAFAGDIVFVRKGNYQESTLEINKSLYLMGEDVEGTILSLNPPLVKTFILHNWLWILSSAVIINAENVKLQGLTISIPRDDNSIASALEIIGSNQLIANNTIGNTLKVQGSFNQIYANDINSTYYFSGIQLNGSNNVLIKNSFQSMTMESSDSNIIGDNVFARLVMEHFGSGCSHNTITKNRVEGNGNFNDGIKVLSGLNNTISANNIRNCEYGLSIGSETTQTSVYLNNFYNSSEQHITCSNLAENRFDNGAKGNYYDTYHSNDGNWDGIGDSPYTIQEIHWDEELKREVTVIYFQDNYPLTAPFDIDSMSIQIPDWASASSNSIPEHQPAEPFPTIWLMATVGVTVIACIGVIVYFKTRISGK